MIKFSTGLMAGAMLTIGVAMLDKRNMKKMKKMAKSMMHSISCC